MRGSIAILFGSALIAAAVVFHAFEARYQGAMAMDGLFVRLDTGTGKLSACTLLNGGSSLNSDAIIFSETAKLKAGGFNDEQVTHWVTQQTGQMACSPWSE